MNKLPSIYSKYGREMDINRGVLYLSTCDYFFLSFICYPIAIGPQIARLLNQIYSSQKWKQEYDFNKKQQTTLKSILSQILPTYKQELTLTIPQNPFKAINWCYGRIFDHYLNMFVPQNWRMTDTHFYNEYGIKFIEIIGELWFGQLFVDKPIGDRCHTLPLMQDLVYRIMEKQLDFQHNYIESNGYSQRYKDNTQDMMTRYRSRPNDSLFGLGKIPKTSCLCPELRCLLRYLYLFFRESFEHFPLDHIKELKVIIEILTYILAPWSIEYKLKNPDQMILRHLSETTRLTQQQQQRYERQRKGNNIFSMRWK